MHCPAPLAGDQQERDLELLSSGLGVLINLASGSESLRARLAVASVTLLHAAGSSTNVQSGAAAPSSPPRGRAPSSSCGEGAPSGEAAPPATLVPLLCQLISHAMQRQHSQSPRCSSAALLSPVLSSHDQSSSLSHPLDVV